MDPQILEQFTTEQILTHLNRKGEPLYVMNLGLIPESMRSGQIRFLESFKDILFNEIQHRVTQDAWNSMGHIIEVTIYGRKLSHPQLEPKFLSRP